MNIQHSGSQPSGKGPAEYFTGTVRIDPLMSPPEPARVAGASVTFEPGARTAWHTHPLGQTLIVTAGCGRVQREGGPIEEIRPGDVVWFAPGEKHWHGATPTTAMTHIAIQEKLNGSPVDWMEHVTDEQYGARALHGATIRRVRKKRTMPHVIVKMWPGKSEEQKARLSDAITRDVMEILNYGEDPVSVAMEEVAANDWTEKVYKPDIRDKWNTLTKKPGYDPLS
jgi:quercetin dioxygenase-like cupin family protein/phenylpyruvate tautomerase PptA (4-oxalocrotonate tautomerase family)